LNASHAETARSMPFPPSALRSEVARTDALQLIMGVLDDAKAEDITAIDLAGKTSIADHMVIASGRSDRHVGAIAEQILSRLKDEGYGNAKVEGMPLCEWVLIDAGDIIVHIFKPEVRNFYNLEKMWSGDRPEEEKARR
jgi:ribosome-associated protein